MRESIGAGWLMTIVIFFVILFSAFLALTINYSKAYRIKDAIIERIERTSETIVSGENYQTKVTGLTCAAQDEIDEYMLKIGYNAAGSCLTTMDASSEYYGINRGTNPMYRGTNTYNYCVQLIRSTQNNVSGGYFKVTVFFSINLPIFDSVNLFGISGETTYMPLPTVKTTC